MAGTAWTTTCPLLVKPLGLRGPFPIKSGEIVNSGDAVSLDTNGQVVVATKATGAVVLATGIAVFLDENGTVTSRTGVAALTVVCHICKVANLLLDTNYAATQVPSIAKGLPVYLGELPSGTVSNYTCAESSTAGDQIQQVGFVDADGLTLLLNVVPVTMIGRQDANNTTLKYV